MSDFGFNRLGEQDLRLSTDRHRNQFNRSKSFEFKLDMVNRKENSPIKI